MPSAPLPAFITHCMELLAPLGHVRTKRMFGGWGLYADDLFVALIAHDRLYLKTDEASRPAFAAAGSQPFVFDANSADGKQTTTSYWSAPDDAMDSPAAMLSWARLALRAAVAARAAKPVPTQRAVKPPAQAPRKPAARQAAASAPATAQRRKPATTSKKPPPG